MRVFLALVLFFGLASAQINNFQADVVVTNDPNVNGIMQAKVFWTKDKYLKYVWSVGVTQVFDYDNDVSYKRCSDCESTTHTDAPLDFSNDGTFTSTGNTKVIDGVTCNGFNRGSGQIRTLWLRPNGAPCQAIQSGGKTFTFSNVDTGALPAGTFSVGNWNCPTKKCKLPADIVVVVDRSGSISDGEWADATRFVKNFANSFGGFQTQAYYNANPNLAVRMGLVWFSTNAQVKIQLTADKTSFMNAANSARGGTGNTNIGDGIQTGLDVLYGKARNVDKFIVFLTDGVNTNNAVDINNQLNRIADFTANRQFTSFAVGVGSAGQLNENVLVRLAGTNRNRYIQVGAYSQLASKLDELLSKTCPANNDSPCNCKGFCACDGKCLCPSSCSKGKCQDAICRNANNGCDAPTPRVCTTTNKCKEPFCNSAVGDEGTCDTRDKVCPRNSCGLPTCDPAVGCGLDKNLTKICTNYIQGCTTCDPNKAAPNQCSTDATCKCAQTKCDTTVRGCKFQSCNPGNPDTELCEDVAVTCDDGNPCTDDSCDPNGLGVCEFKPKTCDDGNLCTTDTCDSAVKDGCVFTPKNVTLECDDFSVCTNDTCVPDKGCVNEIIPCVSVNGTNPCLNTSCDAIMGCVTNPTDCYAANANISLLIGDCQTVQCNLTAGCYLEPIDGAQIDDCGVCKGQERPFFCNKGAVAGIAVGVIAGATVGAVAGAAALGFGAKKGYDFLSDRMAASGGIQNNPLYVDNANNNNPLFNG